MSNNNINVKFTDSELVIGLVGAVGTELDKVIGVIKDRLSAFTYNGELVHLSAEVIPKIIKPKSFNSNNKYERTNMLMDAGNDARKDSKDNSILALGAAAKIGENRPSGENQPAFKPCHNCAKHIIAAGIKRVVYVEPYSKSKAAEFHDDSICLGLKGKEDTLIHFEPFAGVGPRRFFDLFSMNLSSGYPLDRKDDKGKIVEWERHKSKLRIQMVPDSYIARETSVTSRFNIIREEIKNGTNN